MLKNTSGGSQASRIEIQTFFLIMLITIVPRPLGTSFRCYKIPPGPNWDPSVPPVWTTASLKCSEAVMMGVSDHSSTAMPKPLQQCLLQGASPIVCGLAGIGLVQKHWAWRNGLGSGDVSEDFAPFCLFPLQAEFPGQLASTARKNPRAKLRITLSVVTLRGFLFNFPPSMENCVGIFRKKVRQVACHPTEPAPPVFRLQEQLLSSLGTFCSPSFEGYQR